MAEVGSWKDWLLWPLRSRFGTRAQSLPEQELARPPPRDLGLDKWGRAWRYDERDFCEFVKVMKHDFSEDWTIEFRGKERSLPIDGFFIFKNGAQWDYLEWWHIGEAELAERIENLSGRLIKPTESWAAAAEVERHKGLKRAHKESPKVAVFPERRVG